MRKIFNLAINVRLFILLVIIFLMANTTLLHAKKGIVQKPLYVFGVAISFNDSTIYLTDIHTMDSVWINTRNNFLLNRDNYSYELRNYMEKEGLQHRTCAIFYADKLKDIEKRYQRVKDKSIKRGNLYIDYIREENFRFSPIELEDYEIKALREKDAKERKEKNQGKRQKGKRPPMGEGPGGPGGMGGPGESGGPGGGPGGGMPPMD